MPDSNYLLTVEEGGIGYQGCVIININGKRYTATDDIVIALSDLLSLKLKGANETCSKLFVNQTVSEDVLIDKINALIFNIFQLSLELSDPFHRLQLNNKIKIFHTVSESQGEENSDSALSGEENSDSSVLIDKLVTALQKYNPKSIDSAKISNDVNSFFDTSSLDKFSFDFESIYRKILFIAINNADKGYYAIIENLNTLNEQLESYKGQSKIDFLEEDPLTPIDMEFKFAIYDGNGINVGYKKSDYGENGFELFIERSNSRGYYNICCVIHDWNNALVDSLDIREESDISYKKITDNISIVSTSPLYSKFNNNSIKGEDFFEYYKLAKYRKYAIKIGQKTGDFYGYQRYTTDGGKILVASNVKNYSKKGEIILSNCRDEKSNKEIIYTFYVSLKENGQKDSSKTISNDKENASKNASTKIGNRRLRCPYCAIELGIKRKNKSKRYCNGDKSQVKSGILCKNNHYLDDDFFDDDGNVSEQFDFDKDTYKQSNPTQPLLLPPKYTKNVSGIVSLIGKASSGKSVFISNFFGMTDKDMAGNINWNSTIGPFISNSRFSFYKPEPKSEWEIAQKRVFLDERSGTAYSDYVSVLYENGPKRSPEKKNSALVHLPFILEMENSNNGVTGYMSFFDCPGEYIYNESSNSNDVAFRFKSKPNYIKHPVCNSDAYILFIDPTDKIGDEDKVDERIANAQKLMHTLVEVIGDDCKHRAVAVVFSKFDLWISQLITSDDPDNNIQTFLSTVRHLVPEEDKSRVDYQGSNTQQYIDDCSNAVKSYFSNNSAFDALEHELVTSFGSHKYFLVSALGRDSSLRTNGKGKTPSILYRTKSNYNVDIVALWLAVQLGIIK